MAKPDKPNKYALMAETAKQLMEGGQGEAALPPIGREVVATESGRQIGKSRNPEFDRLTVLVRKDTKKKATRLWEDIEPDKDLSDLLEQLLSNFVLSHSNT